MKISNLQLVNEDKLTRAEATFEWEDSDHPPFTMYVQTREEFANKLVADPNSFLRAAILNAWHFGERRVLVKGRLCPVLSGNLQGVFMLLKKWYPNDFGLSPIIECTDGFTSIDPTNNDTISLFSGGVDSVSLLRYNHLYYRKTHPSRIRAVATVEFSRKPAESGESFENAVGGRLRATKPILMEAGLTAIPLLTNIWYLNPDGYFYGQKSYGSQLTTTVSFLNKGYYRCWLASSYDASFSHKPWGSHPQLDAYFTSSNFYVEHIGTEMTRLRKIELLSSWPVALNNLRVCQNDNSGSTNCGTCEKCIRTQLMLEALGKLKGCRSFPKDTVDPWLVEYLRTYDMLYGTDPVHNEEKLHTYGTIADLLEKRKRTDLAKLLREILDELTERILTNTAQDWSDASPEPNV